MSTSVWRHFKSIPKKMSIAWEEMSQECQNPKHSGNHVFTRECIVEIQPPRRIKYDIL